MNTKYKFMPNADYISAILGEHKVVPDVSKLEQKMTFEAQQSAKEHNDRISNEISRRISEKTFLEFSNQVKTAFLTDCLYKIMYESVDTLAQTTKNEPIMKSMINSFIEDCGANKLLDKMKYASALMAEMSIMVSKYHSMVMEAAKKDDPESLVIHPDITDSFFKDLDALNADEAIISIRNRVIEAENDFLDQNAKDQNDIKELLTAAKEKIDAAKTDSMKENYQMQATRKINHIKTMRNRNIYESMVLALSEAAIKNDKAKEVFMIEGKKLDMNKITESVNLMYTLLETVNTLGLMKITPEYISELLSDIK